MQLNSTTRTRINHNSSQKKRRRSRIESDKKRIFMRIR